MLLAGTRLRLAPASCHATVTRSEGLRVHFSVHAHALDLACTAEIAMLPGNMPVKRSSSALTAKPKPANVSRAKLGIRSSCVVKTRKGCVEEKEEARSYKYRRVRCLWWTLFLRLTRDFGYILGLVADGSNVNVTEW